MSVSSSAVDGLVSGLDTTTIISQLIKVDAAPQDALKAKVNASNLKVTAYQSVNSSIAAIQTAADALQKAATWASTKASSSDESITVTAGSSATPASLDVQVDRLATGRSIIGNRDLKVAADGTISNPMDVPIPIDIVRSDGSFVTINPSSGALADVVGAINKASKMGINAVAIRVKDDTYRLQITSSTTGLSKGDFKVVAHTGGAPESDGNGSATYAGYVANDSAWFGNLASTGDFKNITGSQDAQISVGPPNGQFSITSTSNTFADVMPGVAVTVSKVSGTSTPVSGTVRVASDPDAVATAMQGLVDASNAALSNIALQSRSGSVGTTGSITGAGLLRGDTALRTLQSQIMSAVTNGLGHAGSQTSAADFGVQSTRDGKLTFDKSKFLAAYSANPTALQRQVSSVAAGSNLDSAKNPVPDSDGIVERLRNVTVFAVGDLKASPTTASGVLTTTISGQQKSVDDLTHKIADWDVRLAQKKIRYQKYYSSLEVSLGKLKSQGSWLSGQLASLSSS